MTYSTLSAALDRALFVAKSDDRNRYVYAVDGGFDIDFGAPDRDDFHRVLPNGVIVEHRVDGTTALYEDSEFPRCRECGTTGDDVSEEEVDVWTHRGCRRAQETRDLLSRFSY